MSIPPSLDAKTSLPSPRTLARATAVVIVTAALLAVGVVLPAETGRDPLGLGSILGLTEMGQIKVALAREAQSDALAATAGAAATAADTSSAVATSGTAWRDSMRVTLEPNRGVELKLVMQTNDTAYFTWTADAAEVYFNRHGEPPNAPKDFAAHSYAKGMTNADQGEIIAVFDGLHGWFWRNRSDAAVTITLKTRGQYKLLKRL